MTNSKISVIRDWSDSRRKKVKQRITLYTYKDNIVSEPIVKLI